MPSSGLLIVARPWSPRAYERTLVRESVPQGGTLSGLSVRRKQQRGDEMSETKKFVLSESEIPERWYNILPDLPEPPAPYLHPATLHPMAPADRAPIFPQAIIAQEVSAEPWIDIPEQVRDIYKIWRPSPVYRAERLEQALDTPAHIYFKYEGGSPAGSHKPNTAVAQAYYNSK